MQGAATRPSDRRSERTTEGIANVHETARLRRGLWRAQGAGVRAIARRLGRSPSTIARELRRNASTRTYRLDYKASIAQWHAERRARRPKVAKLVINDRLRR
jgi:IS30 family transposase